MSRAKQVEPGPTVVVIGGGIAGLCAARELVAAGLQVTVLESSPGFGGSVASHELAGLALDAGAESFSTRSDTVPALARELGLGNLICTPNAAGAWLYLPSEESGGSIAVPLPQSGLLGIPADVRDPALPGLIGRAASLRAGLDRALPLGALLNQDQLSLGAVVRARMGPEVLKRLVAPVVGGVLSADPDDLDVDAAVPGLRAMMHKHGSLGAAVGAMRKAAPAGTAVAGLEGGMHQLASALSQRLESDGAILRASERVQGLARTAHGWTVITRTGAVQADAVVVATDGPTAVDLLTPTVPGLADDSPAVVPAVALVSLVVDVPQLDAAPRGTGVLVARQTPGVRAKALTHATAKWLWLADRAGPGSHVLRLSFGRGAADDATAQQSDADLYQAALQDASVLLGVDIQQTDVVDWDVVRWTNALPHATLGHRDRVARIRAAAGSERGLEITGAWLAGTGLVAVIDNARDRGAALARRLLANH
ncbi:protoporphyrinogen oxidase [Arthrobacter tumbae]|uniref:protoporphyrinogen oxidase n=1 Tax=Arthrobacter tumbae TaxID=163874 RepID=UPI00195772A9|nr:protoporphyrinogen oxidase [Arthrobacter tumbae]MBM7780197.1 oxygen-dependent protoporphyrinogen oxidase [Arthrobacter tumbae]